MTTTQLDILNAQKTQKQKQKDLNTANAVLANIRLDKEMADIDIKIAILTPPV